MSKGQMAVQARGISKTFLEGEREHRVLNDLSLDIAAGESVALRGRSGSGKSTLLNCLSGIDIPDAGSVSLGAARIDRMSEHERTLFRRREIGFVYQAFNLVPTLSVGDNIRLVLELNGIKEPQASERVRTLLCDVDLADRESSYPDILSGGEQQRVAVARALAHRPSVVLADEPTGNLDDANSQRVLTLLEKLLRESATTLIVATHSSAVAQRCDRVYELHDGKLKSL